MLIQLENLMCVPHDGIILMPVGRPEYGDVEMYDVLNASNGICVSTISAREAAVILALSAALLRDAEAVLSQACVFRTAEWDVTPDGNRLYYRYAKVLGRHLGLSGNDSSVPSWLKEQVRKAADPKTPAEFRSGVCNHIKDLRRDAAFMAEYVHDASQFYIDCLSGSISREMQRLLDHWDEIFTDLPF